MKIVIIISRIKEPKIQIQITNLHVLLIYIFWIYLKLNFIKLKLNKVYLLIFKIFLLFLLKWLTYCDDNNNYYCILEKVNLNQADFIIQERTKFRELNHLVLEFTQANDTIVKKYLGSVFMEFKSKYKNVLENLNTLDLNYKNLTDENNKLKDSIQQTQLEQKTNYDNLLNEKNNEINTIKEQCFQESKSQLEKLEKEKNDKILDLENKILSLQQNLEELQKSKTELEDNKMKLELTQKDLEGKNAISNTELNVYKGDIDNLRQENSNLNQKCFTQEKEITELTFKLENMNKQLEEKEKGGENLNQLVETLTKQRESNEDNIKSLKISNSKLEDKLQTSIKEINKENEIIQKLQNDIKNQKSKLKTITQSLINQQ